MSSQASALNTLVPEAPQLPQLVRIEGDTRQAIPLISFPFTIGRRADKNMVVTDPMASRDHAEIVIVGKKNSIFFPRKFEHRPVVNAGGHVQYRNSIMAGRVQAIDHLAFAVLVRENFHSAARGMIRAPDNKAEA